MKLPDPQHLKLERDASVLHATLDRPEARNALNAGLVTDLENTFATIRDDRTIRTVVLRGAGGHFCAGGDLKEAAAMQRADDDGAALRAHNRTFGKLARAINTAPQAVVAVAEGAALGGGFGLVCVSDVAIVARDATMGMPETRRGLPPAQIAPFVVDRIGLTAARAIAVCGDMIDGAEAHALGVAHYLADDAAGCDAHLADVLGRIGRCAPGANAATKALMMAVGHKDMAQLVDDAASAFTECLYSDEGAEGTRAFVEKRAPNWTTS